MKKKSRKRLLFIIILGLLSIIIYIKTSLNNPIFKNKEVFKISIDYDEQEQITNKLKEYINNKKYTLKNPKIINNPYNNSPLTALIIFTTDDECEVKVYINDSFMTTMEKSKSHIIPIYGLISNYKNKITLEIDSKKYNYYINNNEKELLEKTTYTLNYNPDKYLILNTTGGKYAIDNNKNIVWKSNNTSLDIQFIDSSKYLIKDSNNRIILTDLLGQIYSVYYDNVQPDNHKIKYYDNNMIITTPEYHLKSINLYSNEVNFDIDINKIFTKIDKNFALEKGTYKIRNLYNLYHMNNYEYNKENNTILISLRELDAIVNYDIGKEEIIWIFSDNKVFNKNFDKYKLQLTNGDYFHGQHSPYLDGNKLYVFDNNYNGNNEKVRAIIYEIDKMKAKEIYSYDSKYSLSLYGGSFYEENGIKQINYGCTPISTEGKYEIIELNENNKIMADLSYNIQFITTAYSSFRHKFYDEKTPNYEFNKIKKIDKKINNGKFLNIFEKIKIKKSPIDENLLEINNNKIKLLSKESCTVILISEDNRIHKINYNDEESIINIESYLTTISGKYAIYIKFDNENQIYNTNKAIDIN